MKYKIIARTNPWIASRDIHFNGRTSYVMLQDLTLREAHAMLLSYFNSDYETYFSNWGLARCNYPCDTCSHADGTRSYYYDSRYYSIEKQEEE